MQENTNNAAISHVHSIRLSGVNGVPVTVECAVMPGIGIHLVGLADAAVKESLLRTVTALQANGYAIPGKKIVLNITPADLHKQGSGYDLPIALTLIAASGQDNGAVKDLDKWLILGELGLDGSVREVPGCVQAVGAAIQSGCKGVIIPKLNGVEIVDLISEDDIPVYGVHNLMEALVVLSGYGTVPTIWDDPVNDPTEDHESEEPAWNRISGNEGARRAIKIAAAGGHHILLAGASETERSMLARALRDILPPMTREESIDTARIWSAAGKGAFRAAGTEGVYCRPFRAPHHSASLAALIGGGAAGSIMPGEVSLASGGVLYIDEFGEAPKAVKEALRGPLEDGEVTISRLKSKVTIPSRFQLVAGTALCPCGHYGEGDSCTCTQEQRLKYLQGLSGPVFDSIDLQTIVHEENEPAWKKHVPREGEDAASVAGRVAAARAIQRERFGDGRLNADMTAAETELHCVLGDEGKRIMQELVTKLSLSMRACGHILKVARTIADLAGEERIGGEHIAEAACYRFLDRRTETEN